MMNERLIDVALGNAPADLVIRGGKLINVLTREIYEADVAIAGGTVAATGKLEEGTIGPETKVIDAAGTYLAPGFIDAHIHFESSMLTYTEFNRMVLPHGTTAVASDMMEISIVAGREAIDTVLDEAAHLPVKLLYPVPSFMGDESDLQTIGAPLHPEMIEELIDLPQAVGLAEVLYPPILGKSPESAHVLELAASRGKTAEGHAPALYGAALNAYATAGIRSDHESTNPKEALEKLRRGIRVLMREGCAATDLLECLKILTENHVDSRNCAMVSDDIDMLHIYQKGHLDHKVRMAVAAGIDPVEAIQMVTINPAESLKVADRYGAIAPGKNADIVLLSDLPSCRITGVIANGEVAVENGAVVCHLPEPKYPAAMRNTIKLSQAVTAQDLQIAAGSGAKTCKVHVIGGSATSLLTEKQEAVLAVKDGKIQPDPERDVLSIACVERYGKNGSIGRSFISGFGLKSGAMATSVGHDHHNITVVGSNPEDMAIAVNRLAELNGGIILVDGGKVIGELPLPICGLLSDRDGIEMAKVLDALQKELHARGCGMSSPYMSLSFITLIYIPMLAITDRGLMDVLGGTLIDPVIEER